MGASLGTTNSNEVGPTGTMGPLPMRGTGCVNSLALLCELTMLKWEEEVSPIAVALNLIREWDSSSGGRTPTPLQGILNSLPIHVLQVSVKEYS